MAEGAAAAAIVGTGFSIFSQIEEAKAQEEAALAQATAKEAQAVELLRRNEFNIDQLQREATRFKARQLGAVVASGATIDSSVSLLQLEQTNRDLFREISAQREEALFKARALRAGADIDTRLAGDIREAGNLRAIGTAIGGAGRLAGSGIF